MPTEKVHEEAATKTGLTVEDVIRIIEASRKPVPTEKELRDKAAQDQERHDLHEIYLQGERNKKAEQNYCQHEYNTGVGTPVVYISSLNRLYCQHCNLWIFPTAEEAAFHNSRVTPELHPGLWNRYYGKAMLAATS